MTTDDETTGDLTPDEFGTDGLSMVLDKIHLREANVVLRNRTGSDPEALNSQQARRIVSATRKCGESSAVYSSSSQRTLASDSAKRERANQHEDPFGARADSARNWRSFAGPNLVHTMQTDLHSEKDPGPISKEDEPGQVS